MVKPIVIALHQYTIRYSLSIRYVWFGLSDFFCTTLFGHLCRCGGDRTLASLKEGGQDGVGKRKTKERSSMKTKRLMMRARERVVWFLLRIGVCVCVCVCS